MTGIWSVQQPAYSGLASSSIAEGTDILYGGLYYLAVICCTCTYCECDTTNHRAGTKCQSFVTYYVRTTYTGRHRLYRPPVRPLIRYNFALTLYTGAGGVAGRLDASIIIKFNGRRHYLLFAILCYCNYTAGGGSRSNLACD